MGLIYVGGQTNRPDLGEAFREYVMNPKDRIALNVLPFVEVSTRADNFPVVERADLLRIERGTRAAGGHFDQVDVRMSEDEYSCKDNGFEFKWPIELQAEFSKVLDTERLAVETLALKCLLKMEYGAASALFNTTTFTGSALFTDRSAAPWATAATDIPGHVHAAKEKVRANTGMEANTLIIGAALLPALMNNTAVKAAAGIAAAAPLTYKGILASLPAIFGLERLEVGGMVRNSAAEGLAFSGSDIWGSTYAMVARCASPESTIIEPGLGRTFYWTEAGTGREAEDLDTYYDASCRSEMYQKSMYYDQKVIDAMFGHLLDVAA